MRWFFSVSWIMQKRFSPNPWSSMSRGRSWSAPFDVKQKMFAPSECLVVNGIIKSDNVSRAEKHLRSDCQLRPFSCGVAYNGRVAGRPWRRFSAFSHCTRLIIPRSHVKYSCYITDLPFNIRDRPSRRAGMQDVGGGCNCQVTELHPQ